MTEFSDEHDELASAYLDGEATDDERARVDGDPDLLARVDELRRVREAVATPTAAPSARARDDAIAAALHASTVVDLGAERARRRLRIASIAAAVLIVIGAAGLVIRSASTNSTKTSATAAAGSTASPADSRSENQATGGTSGAENIPGAFPLQGRDALGDFTDRSALAEAATTRVRDRLSVDHGKRTADAPSGSASQSAASANDAAIAPPICAVSAPPTAVAEVYAASASLDGRPVQLDVFSTTDDSLILVVTDAATCAQLFTQSV